MARARPRLVAVPPSSRGLEEGLRQVLQHDSIVTGYHDARLRLASQLVQDESVEFLAFGDVLSRVLRMQGESVDRIVSRAQRIAITQLACHSLRGDSSLERSARFPGMARLIAQHLERLRHFGIGTSVLHQLESVAPPEKAEKFRVLADISNLVQDSMDAAKREYATDRALRSTESKPLTGPLQHLIVVAGPDEHPVFDTWLNWLAAQGVGVDVIVDLIPTRTDLFLSDQRTAARIGTQNLTVIGEKSWAEVLFTEEVASHCPELETFSASDPLSEADWIIRRCVRLMEDGVAPEEIGVFLRDQDLYAPLLATASQLMDVPLSGSRSVPLLSCGLAHAVTQLLQALSSNDLRKVARLAKSSYFPTESEFEAALWQTALDLRRSPTDRWASLEGWLQGSEQTPSWLAEAIEWRKSVINGSATLTVWLDRFRTLIGESKIFESSLVVDEAVKSRDVRAQTVLQRALADYAFVYDQAGHRELSFAEFVQHCVRTWEDETVLVQGDPVGVRLLFDAEAIAPVSCLFVPGMLEGSIPRRRREDPLLDDEDLAFLSEAIGTIIPDSRAEVEKERDQLVRLCFAASERIVFSYPLTDEERDNIPAYYLQELKRAVGGRVQETHHPRSDWVPGIDQCLSEMDKKLRAAYDAVRDPSPVAHLREDYARDLVRADLDKGVHPKELADVLTCPMAAAMRHRLKVFSPLRRAGVTTLLQLPVAARLAEIPDAASAERALNTELNALLGRISPHLEDWESELLRATGERLIREWVDREFAARELWPHSDTLALVPLGSNGMKNDPNVDGRPVTLSGTVPAASMVAGFSVIQLFEQSLPELEGFEGKVETNNDAFELGLLLMVQYQRGVRGVGLEIDSAGGGRRLYLLPKSESAVTLRGDAQHDMSTRSIGSPSALRVVKERLRQAVAQVEASNAMATPGAHCEWCPYGEICRVSSENGDTDSPFGEDTT